MIPMSLCDVGCMGVEGRVTDNKDKDKMSVDKLNN